MHRTSDIQSVNVTTLPCRDNFDTLFEAAPKNSWVAKDEKHGAFFYVIATRVSKEDVTPLYELLLAGYLDHY
jgi:hypothetical protein